MHPPPPHFLLSPHDPSRPPVSATVDLDSDIIHVTIGGAWNGSLSLEASQAIDKCLAQQPLALLLDLRSLDDPDGRSATCWTAAVARATRRRPPVAMVVCANLPDALATRLVQPRTPQLLKVFPSPAQANAALQGRLSPVDRIRTPLPCHADTPRLARTIIAVACETWGMAQLSPAARTVVSELVVNGLETGTEAQLIVTRRPDGVHIAVFDREPQLPTFTDRSTTVPDVPTPKRGRGLRLVHAIAAHWGATPTVNGKVVWAHLCLPPD